MREIVQADADVATSAPGGVFAGPAGFDAQELGAVVLASNGLPKRELYAPLVRQSLFAVALAPTVEQAERISGAVQTVLQRGGRRVVLQPSDGHEYLVHFTEILGGPNAGKESEEIHSNLLIVETMVGTEEVS
jgi:hypothetical protein